jgi:hypothetical protein
MDADDDALFGLLLRVSLLYRTDALMEQIEKEWTQRASSPCSAVGERSQGLIPVLPPFKSVFQIQPVRA